MVIYYRNDRSNVPILQVTAFGIRDIRARAVRGLIFQNVRQIMLNEKQTPDPSSKPYSIEYQIMRPVLQNLNSSWSKLLEVLIDSSHTSRTEHWTKYRD